MLSAGDQRGFEATVTHPNGVRYAEHQIEDVPLSSVCYLQSQEGKVYVIHLRATQLVKQLNPRHDWIVAYRVDGRLIHQVALRKGAFHEVCSEMHSEDEETIYQGKLTFAKVSTTDDDCKVTLDEEVKEGLGEIRIDIYDGRYGREVAWTEPVIAKADVGIAQESQVNVSAVTPYVSKPDDKEVQFHYNDSSAPFYSFVFLHRTKMALEILGVIEFDRDAPEERPVLRAAGKRKRSPGTSANANDVCGHVRPDSEEENPHIWPGSEDDRDVLARENAELRRQLRIANLRNPAQKGLVADAIDLTGIDDEDE